MKTPQDLLTKVCSNRPGNMTKLQPHPYMVRSLLKSFQSLQKADNFGNIVCNISDVWLDKFVQIMFLG